MATLGKTVLVAVLGMVTLLAGCSAGTTAGGIGLGAGLGISETIKGMQADLERREVALVQRYNDLLAAGAKADDLEAVKQDIEHTVQLRQGVQTGKTLLGVDWSDPKAVGGAAGLIGTLVWTWLSKRRKDQEIEEMSEHNRQLFEEKELLNTKYIAHKAGQASFEIANPDAGKQLYAAIGSERIARGL